MTYADYFRRLWFPTFYHWDAFWYGAVLGLYWHRFQSLSLNVRRGALAVSAALLAVYVVLIQRPELAAQGFGQILNPLWGTAISFGLILGIEAIPTQVLRFSGLPWIGRISYTLYLTHKSILCIAAKLSRQMAWFAEQSWMELGFCVLVLVVAGYALYRLFEVPVLNLQDHFFANRHPAEPRLRSVRLLWT